MTEITKPRLKRRSRPAGDSPLILPAFRKPQLATLSKQVPTGDGWLFETKYDGYRCQAAIVGPNVRLYSRRGHDWSRQFGYVAPGLSRLTSGTLLLDGEICAIDETGRANFTLLKNTLDGKHPPPTSRSRPRGRRKCGTSRRVVLSLYSPQIGDYGSLELRRPLPAVTVVKWRTVKLGDDV